MIDLPYQIVNANMMVTLSIIEVGLSDDPQEGLTGYAIDTRLLNGSTCRVAMNEKYANMKQAMDTMVRIAERSGTLFVPVEEDTYVAAPMIARLYLDHGYEETDIMVLLEDRLGRNYWMSTHSQRDDAEQAMRDFWSRWMTDYPIGRSRDDDDDDEVKRESV